MCDILFLYALLKIFEVTKNVHLVMLKLLQNLTLSEYIVFYKVKTKKLLGYISGMGNSGVSKILESVKVNKRHFIFNLNRYL